RPPPRSLAPRPESELDRPCYLPPLAVARFTLTFLIRSAPCKSPSPRACPLAGPARLHSCRLLLCRAVRPLPTRRLNQSSDRRSGAAWGGCERCRAVGVATCQVTEVVWPSGASSRAALDADVHRLAPGGGVRTPDYLPLGALIEEAIAELELHRQDADLCRLRSVWFLLGRLSHLAVAARPALHPGPLAKASAPTRTRSRSASAVPLRRAARSQDRDEESKHERDEQ